MESLQLAQMLADLSDLAAAQESEAAVALVTANKALVAPAPEQSKPVEQQRHHHRVASASGIISRTASPARFDKFGRRILTPPISRSNSAQGSIPGTPRRDSEVSTPSSEFGDSGGGGGGGSSGYNHRLGLLTQLSILLVQHHAELDVDRATSLMALYEIREKLKQQDNMGMARAREKIIALEAKRHAQQMAAPERKDHLHPADTTRFSSRYTYPKAT